MNIIIGLILFIIAAIVARNFELKDKIGLVLIAVGLYILIG